MKDKDTEHSPDESKKLQNHAPVDIRILNEYHAGKRRREGEGE